MIVFFTALIIISIATLAYIYRRKGRKVFTVKKMTIMSMFLTIFIIQTAIGIPFSGGPFKMFSFEIVTILAVGFLFGPLEGMMYGMTSGWVGMLIGGYFQLMLFGFIKPLAGLMAGLAGYAYVSSKKRENNLKNAIVFQLSIILVTLLPFLTFLFLSNTSVSLTVALITALVSFTLMQILFFVSLRKEKEDKGEWLTLITVIVVLTILYRALSIYLYSYAVHYYYSIDLRIAFLDRIITSSYLVPSTAFITTLLVSTSIYAANQSTGTKSFGMIV